MPVRFKNEKTYEKINKIISRNAKCKLCGKPITPDVTKNLFCLDCNLKYPERIRSWKKRGEMPIE